MKRGLLILILLIFAIPSLAVTIDYSSSWVNRTSGDVKDYPNLQVTQLKYEPYPVKPGEYFTLWVKVKNIANQKADNAFIEFPGNYPFSTDDEKRKTIGQLGSLEEALIKFEKVRVDENAIEGEYDLELILNRGGGYVKELQIEKVEIYIRTISPELSVQVSSHPERMPQGGISELNITLKNQDNSMVNDVTARLDLPTSIIPVGSTNQKKIDKILPNSEQTLTFQLTALGDAVSKAYSINLGITFTDITGTTNKKNTTIGVLIGSEVTYDFNIEERDPLRKNSKGNVVLGLSNIGASDMKYTSLTLEDTDQYSVISERKKYLGNLEPDDFETSEFEIYPKQEGKIILIAKLVYKDNYNQEKTEYNEVPLKIYTYQEAKQYGLIPQSGNILNTILIILLVIFVYITFKRWREEKDLGKAVKLALISMLKGFVNIIKWFRWRNLKRLPRKIKILLS